MKCVKCNNIFNEGGLAFTLHGIKYLCNSCSTILIHWLIFYKIVKIIHIKLYVEGNIDKLSKTIKRRVI